MIVHKYIQDVSSLSLDIALCVGCKMCVIVCPHRIFKMNGKKAEIIDKDRCMECGACMKNCAESAITVRVGVGCAAGVINSYFNRSNTVSC